MSIWNALKFGSVFLAAALLVARTSATERVAAQTAPFPVKIAATPIRQAQPAEQPAASPTTPALDQIDRYSQPPTTSEPNSQLSQIDKYSQPPTAPVGQVTSVSQLTDVRPTDWAFQALQSLVERYGCIVGYPDSTYRGNRALTRYEFAAGLNACLNRVNELIAAATSDLVRKEDLATLQRLQEEFAAELATLRGRVDALEARTTQLEARQFSTTTKLTGEAIFALNGFTGSRQAVISGRSRATSADLKDNATFSDRERLAFNTSFSGKDLLRVRLQSRNTTSIGPTVTGTNMTRLAFEGDESNSIFVDQLFYKVPLTNKVVFQVDATNVDLIDRGFSSFSPFESSARGAVSRYGRMSPIMRLGQNNLVSGANITTTGGGAGASLHVNSGGSIGLDLAYLVPTANNPGRSFGVVTGSYEAIAQIDFQPTKAFGLGLTYARTYDNFSRRNGTISILEGVGSQLANAPFGNVPTSANHYSVEASFRISPKFIIFGWGGYTQAIAERNLRFSVATNANGVNLTGPTGSKADIFYYAGGLAFPDFGKEGSLLGFLFGQPPKLVNNDSVREFNVPGVTTGANILTSNGRRRRDGSTSYHIEGFYRYALSNNIDITPGVFVILNPEDNSSNGTEYVGTIRTTFRF